MAAFDFSAASCFHQRQQSTPSEDAISIDAAIAMRATFARDSTAVRLLFDALVDLLTGSGRRH